MPYTNERIKEGDTVSMQIDGPCLTFFLNDWSLGLAFTDKWLATPIIKPFVFLANHNDKIEILEGSTMIK